MSPGHLLHFRASAAKRVVEQRPLATQCGDPVAMERLRVVSMSAFLFRPAGGWFSIISVVAALAATASATFVPTYNSTSTIAPYYPTGTGAPTGTAAPTVPVPSATFSTTPFPGAAPANVAGSALALVIAGGVALII
ncbi:hypothetical protein BCR34DRAFT_615887 [Clohesyomyces aquaticus]|uniref:Uncharacterized protein n=1 Tax=Clohesyomyces aquaticus TaxID=1231657 RepID=A0A1Y1ZG93_9PLEO|nr:hypothetical protein BCR34DRAFT_615887 [Clohesyomyces aquaticus]